MLHKIYVTQNLDVTQKLEKSCPRSNVYHVSPTFAIIDKVKHLSNNSDDWNTESIRILSQYL